jgi:hypothetical protein
MPRFCNYGTAVRVTDNDRGLDIVENSAKRLRVSDEPTNYVVRCRFAARWQINCPALQSNAFYEEIRGALPPPLSVADQSSVHEN